MQKALQNMCDVTPKCLFSRVWVEALAYLSESDIYASLF